MDSKNKQTKPIRFFVKIFPGIFFCLILLSGNVLSAQGDILVHADRMPYFPSCEGIENGTDEKRNCSNHALVNFISNHIEYPDEAKNENIEGAVIISFVVDENGSITNPYILRDIGGGCGEEALRVILQMPSWEPAIHEEKLVKVKLNIPIQFSLKQEGEIASKFKITWGKLTRDQITKSYIKEHIKKPIQVRDQFGNELKINGLTFTYEKGKRYIQASSNGHVSKEMEKVAKRAGKGGEFTLVVTVQEHGELINVQRTYEVIGE